MEYRDEITIAEKAERMLTRALKNKTSSFADHYRGDDQESIKQSFAKAKVKKYGRKRDGNQKAFMRHLAIKMPKHGFVQHYGVNTIRAGGFRERKKPNNIKYHYSLHDIKMKAHPFIDKAIEESKVVEYVSKNVAKVRGKTFAEELVFPLSKFTK